MRVFLSISSPQNVSNRFCFARFARVRVPDRNVVSVSICKSACDGGAARACHAVYFSYPPVLPL
jgi:hypothetical protein